MRVTIRTPTHKPFVINIYNLLDLHLRVCDYCGYDNNYIPILICKKNGKIINVNLNDKIEHNYDMYLNSSFTYFPRKGKNYKIIITTIKVGAKNSLYGSREYVVALDKTCTRNLIKNLTHYNELNVNQIIFITNNQLIYDDKIFKLLKTQKNPVISLCT